MTPVRASAARLAGKTLLGTQSDERLLQLMRDGHELAFEAIVQRYGGPLLRYCSRLLPGSRAEDALQETLMRAHRNLPSTDDPDFKLKAWLYRVAHNVCIDGLRQKGWSHEELDAATHHVEGADRSVERSEDLRSVLAAVEGLPERQRDAIVLRELEGRSRNEIAVALGVSEPAVRQLLFRARGTLRAGLTAITPYGFVARLAAGGGQEVSVATLTQASIGGSALGAKALAAVLATGVVVGGAAQIDPPGRAPAKAEAQVAKHHSGFVEDHEKDKKPAPESKKKASVAADETARVIRQFAGNPDHHSSGGSGGRSKDSHDSSRKSAGESNGPAVAEADDSQVHHAAQQPPPKQDFGGHHGSQQPGDGSGGSGDPQHQGPGPGGLQQPSGQPDFGGGGGSRDGRRSGDGSGGGDRDGSGGTSGPGPGGDFGGFDSGGFDSGSGSSGSGGPVPDEQPTDGVDPSSSGPSSFGH